MKQTHKQKVKLARKMMTDKEKRKKTNLFDSAEWNKRKMARIKKIKRQKINKRKDKNYE